MEDVATTAQRKPTTTITIILFVIALLSAVALGYYHRDVRGGESYHAFATFPKDEARPIILAYGEGGILHELISPNSLGGTIGLTNIRKPVTVKMELVDVPEGLHVHWGASHTRDFNMDTKTVERVILPGGRIAVHHTFYIGEELRTSPIIYNGGLNLMDAKSGETLVFVPIKIINKKIPQEGS
jgi:hypothetical protein